MEGFRGTPGPWRIRQDLSSGTIITVQTEIDATEWMSLTLLNAKDEDTQVANAHLIAAAPELLEALISLSNRVARDCSIGSDPKFMELLKQWQKAHWAIKKALGEESSHA